MKPQNDPSIQHIKTNSYKFRSLKIAIFRLHMNKGKQRDGTYNCNLQFDSNYKLHAFILYLHVGHPRVWWI